ncbi:uncharacterized protein LOC117496995 [Trematomus bernacchii]|uniref:uncharacterized protein LOC117496995 n=1 Tax=Trematomus bernacchii TaxID=40690 RepID=UPI00146A274F|nr:uncharacterized protein LOC117496995 [Trematomus bernacchii]
MAAALLLLLQLVSLASASHHYGGTVTYSYKGRNPDGSFRVDFRDRATYDGCQYSHYQTCSTGNCGYVTNQQRGITDRSTNAPQSNRQWCETETVQQRKVPTDKPFQLRASSCCWIPTRNGVSGWRFQTQVDLGSRSDTGKPNRSPDIAILPFLRVPQNCPRTYKLMSFDADGDTVRCRYGNIRNIECSGCNQPSGFILDQGSCSLHYRNAIANPSVFGFELVVEDFPERPISLSYTDGTQSYKAPLIPMRHKRSYYHTYPPTTSAPITTPAPNTMVPATHSWWWWYHHTPPAPTTTAAPTTTPWWWWHHPAPAPTTTAAPTTTPWWWWYHHSPPAPTTTSAPTTTPWWWWYHHPAPSPTTTAAPTTTPWWWWYHHPTPATTTRQTPAPPIPTYWPWLHTTPTTTDNRHLHGTTPPLSKLPLQFSFLVDPPAPSCVDGLYLPKFVHPTPENGQHINAEVNKEVEIRVRAQASHATLHDIIISGPLNITKHRSTHGDFVIRWTPGPDDVGDHYPICFAVESVIDPASTLPPQTTIYYGYHLHVTQSPQSGIYQSEMRCVLVNIGKRRVESRVTCHESSMTVEVNRSSLPGLHEDHLRLNDPSNTACNLQMNSNSTHIIAIVPLNACGTQIEEDEENLVFKNEITTVDNVHDLITRNHLLEVQFYCQYPKRGNVSQGFTAHRRNVVVWDKGFGSFTYEFEFYPDSQYRQMIDPGLYPLEYDVKNRIYMQIEAKSTVNNTELFVESCSAAPYDTPNYWPTYSIIENGCNLDQTVQVHPSANQGQFRFSMEAFKFIGLHDQVYISCSVLMCEAGSSGTRCSQGCINSPLTGHHHHRKREAITQSARHFISQGPLRLKRSAESTGSPVTPLNLNLVFIVGCLLAAVGMISAVALYKVRASKVKYQPLPSFEN